MIPIRGRKLIGQDNLNDNLSPSVKLNNPLMGTETRYYSNMYQNGLARMLNLLIPNRGRNTFIF